MRIGEGDKDVSGRGLCNFNSRLWTVVKDKIEGIQNSMGLTMKYMLNVENIKNKIENYHKIKI